MENYINKINKKNLSFFIIVLFLFTISQQDLFKENHVLLIYALKNFDAFKNLNNDFVTDFTNHIPIYTGLVFFLVKYFSIKSLYVLHYILLFICAFSIYKVFDKIFKFTNLEVIIWLTLYCLIFHENSYFSGVAGQSVINQTLQPSSFGVFFFVSLALYLNSNLILSVLSLCLAVYFHPTYLIHSIFFITGYSIYNLLYKNYKNLIKINIIFLLFILPVILFLYKNFIINENHINDIAQEILVEKRIPHHANIQYWFSYKDLIAISILFIGLILIRDNKLFFTPIFTISFLTISISLIQYLSNSNFLALLFPWRSSVFLIPLSSLIILTILIKKTKFIQIFNYKTTMSFFIIIFSIFFYKNIFLEEKYNERLKDKNNLFTFLTESREIKLLISPTYIEDIRLNTSIPIFVNWKFHAFRNNEIVKWYNRIQIINEFYGAEDKNDQHLLLNKINNIQTTSHILLDLEKQKELLIDCKIINFNKNYILYDSRECKK